RRQRLLQEALPRARLADVGVAPQRDARGVALEGGGEVDGGADGARGVGPPPGVDGEGLEAHGRRVPATGGGGKPGVRGSRKASRCVLPRAGSRKRSAP